MSLAAINWAWELERLDPTEKLVLLAICDCHNGETGVCCPSRQYIARRACVGVRSVSRWMHSLEQRGLIRRLEHFDEEGRRRANDIEVLLHEATPATTGGVTSDKGEGVAGDKDDLVTGDKAIEPEEGTGRRNRTRRARVGRLPVTDRERELSQQVLAVWNELAGQSMSSSDWTARIIGRIREHPELELADHRLVIEAALADPWWTGPPTPSVVYGNGALFERSSLLAASGAGVATAAAERFGRLLAVGREGRSAA